MTPKYREGKNEKEKKKKVPIKGIRREDEGPEYEEKAEVRITRERGGWVEWTARRGALYVS
jgi:purine nucleoside phosphorylase